MNIPSRTAPILHCLSEGKISNGINFAPQPGSCSRRLMV